ncbi:ABC transporter substrate-binding protein [Pseudonocardia phyllosphaerae]|uniref:ABC transporter substrate-binding protein n=1 Tax=Pseudonocardia phyllosphaerae TaxID=3390502 RepID=UPI00397A9E61
MGTLAIGVDEFAAVAPSLVFDQFGRDGSGWLFGAACDRVEVGAVVTLRAPLGGGPPVEILGRISELRRPRSLTITHDQPWRGRIRLRFSPAPGGTRIRLDAEIDEQGLEWLMRRRGHPVRDREPSGPRLGALTSRSGSGSLFAAAVGNVAALAVDEINAADGVAGRPVELLQGDDATDPGTGALEALRLARAGCRTILLTTTSATYDAVSAALEGQDVLVLLTNMNEGGGESRLRIRLGERPQTQLRRAAVPLMRSAGGHRWFLAGNDYVWPRTVNAIAREVLPEQGATLVGESYAALGARDFTPLIERIAASGADIVLNTFVGADGAAFERQCHAMGLRDSAISLAPAMDEASLERIGADAATGIHGVSGYFQHLQTERNGTLLERYREAFGPWAPPLSSLSESMFEAIHVWAAAARKAGGVDPYAVADAIRHGRFEVPRGTICIDGADHADRHLHLATARGGTFVAMTDSGRRR